MSIKLLKQLALASVLALASIASAHAGTYHYENMPAPSSIMNDYSTTWNQNTETLSINSSWTNPANPITKISFLISDGGSPWLTTGEQFLWYDVDLASSVVTVKNYFAWDGNARLSQVLDTFTGAAQGVVTTANSLSLTLDHTLLNGLTFTGKNYKGAGFTNDIGIWYYMYSGTQRLTLVETLDVHHGTPSAVPVPAALFLFAPALLGLLGFRRKLV
ncbi:MAG: hypothetical protein ACKE8G_05360 [Methylophagaceae bacterium]